MAAGSAALTTLSRLKNIEPDLLEAIEETLPEDRNVDLDIGIADLVARVGENTLAGTEDPAVRGQVHYVVGARELWAGRHQRALDALLEAEAAFQVAVAEEPGTCEEAMAAVLTSIAGALTNLGRLGEALFMTERAIDFLEFHVINGKELHLAMSYNNMSALLQKLDRTDEAVAAARGAARLLRDTTQDEHGYRLPLLSAVLGNLAQSLESSGNYEAALSPLQESLRIRAELAAEDRSAHEPELAETVLQMALHMAQIHADMALGIAEEAVTIWRSLSATNPTAFEPNLARALLIYSVGLSRAGRNDEALTASQQAVDVFSRRGPVAPTAFDEVLLANAQSFASRHLSKMGEHREALATANNTVTTIERLRDTHPETFTPAYIGALVELSLRHAAAGSDDEALAAIEKALSLLLPLAEASPNSRWSRDLANVYFKRGVSLVAVGRREEALADFRRSAAILRQAIRQEPSLKYDLVGALEGLGRLLIETGHHVEAKAVHREYGAIRKSLGHGA
jgi:tetratricopeptide (TPR) repeat protein